MNLAKHSCFAAYIWHRGDHPPHPASFASVQDGWKRYRKGCDNLSDKRKKVSRGPLKNEICTYEDSLCYLFLPIVPVDSQWDLLFILRNIAVLQVFNYVC